MTLKKFYIESLGCPKNQVDSEEMIASLVASNYTYCNLPDEADIIIVNTCGFIEDAKKESIETVLQFKQLYPGKKVIVAGCLSQRYKDVLPKELSEIDAFVGTSGPSEIVNVVSGLDESIEPSGSLHNISDLAALRTNFLSYPGSTYVKISEGCNNRCSYCAIPLIRGNLSSRSIESITSEIEHLLGRGIIEINLVAQDCGSFGADRGRPELPELLDAISKLAGQFWIRLLYIHPDHFPFGIFDTIGRDPRFLPYFDIPFQHASKRILSGMGRKGSPEIYLGLVRKIREIANNAVIRSTFLVGFPGETDADVAELMDFQERAELDWAGVFRYSKEEGTAAYKLGGSVRKSSALSRKKQVEEIQLPITERMLERFVGNDIDVIVEEEVKGEKLYLARGYMHAPEIDGLVIVHGEDLIPGSIVRVKLLRRNGIDFEAQVT